MRRHILNWLAERYVWLRSRPFTLRLWAANTGRARRKAKERVR